MDGDGDKGRVQLNPAANIQSHFKERVIQARWYIRERRRPIYYVFITCFAVSEIERLRACILVRIPQALAT